MAGGQQEGREPADRPGLDPEDFARPLFSATLRPHQSLPRAGFRAVMLVFGLLSLVSGLISVSLGFWPIAGFFGLDVLALYLALRASLGRGRGFEEILATRVEVMLARVTHRGERREWRFNPLWTRLQRHEDDEFGLLDLALVSRGRRVAVARDVSPGERERVAEGLGRALASAKKGF
jgi:uncharacterized membrane protein